MLVVRGTKKLRDRLKGVPANGREESTTALGDWYANALLWRPQVVLLVNERTLLPVFLPLAPAATLADRIPEAIASVLRRHGVSESFLATEREAMDEIRFAPTNNRSVLGVMNEYALHGELRSKLDGTDLDDLSLVSSQLILGPLQHGTARDELAALLGPAEPLAEVIPLGGRDHPGHAQGTPPSAVYQLKVTLLGTKPPVWRRVVIDATSTLDHLHEVIQAAFGWWGYHLHDFEVGNTRYGIPDPDWDVGPPIRDERDTRLDQIASAGDSFRYTYDFGDNWEHKITVEKVQLPSADTAVPALVGGRRACPPEDCGGPWGYEDLLAILADPTHPEHDERKEWIGRQFDPEAFDPAEFEDNLRNARLASFDD
jgi:hypothetical protein